MEGVLVLLFITLLVVFLVTRKAAIKAFSKSYELPPAQDIHEHEQEWPHLSKIRKAEEARRRQQEADEALKYAGTPDKPYVQKLTAEEQAVKLRIEGRTANPLDEQVEVEAKSTRLSKKERKAARKARREQLIKELEENPPIQKPEPEKRGGNGLKTYYPSKINKPPAVKRGPRGGRYTEDRTKDGRPYRRYF